MSKLPNLGDGQPDSIPEKAVSSNPKTRDGVESCMNCRFWAESSKLKMGKCRRWPPVLVKIRERETGTADYDTRWPETDPVEWCGEYARRRV